MRFGEEILPGNRGIDADLLADLEMVVESLERGRRDIPYYGVGFGAAASDAGAYPISTAQVRVETDGSVIVLSGTWQFFEHANFKGAHATVGPGWYQFVEDSQFNMQNDTISSILCVSNQPEGDRPVSARSGWKRTG